MTRPTQDMTERAKALMAAVRDADGGHRALMERLDAFFPDSPGFAWLSDDDRTVELVFTSADGGWLDPPEDAEFWRIVAEQAQQDLVGLLERLVDGWRGAAEGAVEPDHHEPAGQAGTPGIAGPRFLEVEPVPGTDHPGWWRGYDSAHEVWKYIHSGDRAPTDESPGWVTHLQAVVPAQQPLDLDTALDQAVAAAIDDVRSLGVTADQMSDEEIIDALHRAMADELSAG